MAGFYPPLLSIPLLNPLPVALTPFPPPPTPPLSPALWGDVRRRRGEGVRLCRGKTAKLEPIKVTGKKFGKMAAWIMDVPAPISTKVHCKKRLSFFLSPAGMSLTNKLSLAGNY